MKELTKLASLLLLALLTACESNENITEITGKVIDIDTNAPVAGADLNLVVAEGLNQVGEGFVNPVNYSLTTNSEGAYSVILSDNAKQVLYAVTAGKTGYVPVKEPSYIAEQLKTGQRNLHDTFIARGSFLKITVNKTADETAEKELVLNISHVLHNNTTPQQGHMIATETVELNPKTASTNLVRGFYFKRTNTVQLQWAVTTTGDKPTTETFNQTINLIEHDTAHVAISY